MAGVRTHGDAVGAAAAAADVVIEATIEHDADGCIVAWDTGAERLLGWRAIDALGRKSDILVPERNRARQEKARADMLVGRTSAFYRRMITVVHRDGREFPVHMSIGRIEGPGGHRLMAQLREVPAAGEAPPLDVRALAILDQIEDGCSVLDLRGTYLYANAMFCGMVGRPQDEIVGARYSAVMSAERAQLVSEIYSEVYRTGTPNRGFEFEGTGADGSIAFFEQSVSLQRDLAGRPIGFLAVARDCTARRLAEQQTTRAREAAEAANRAKSEFLANMSHEIRTPMNGIIGMTDLALDTRLTDYQLECLTAVKASAESLLTILNDILDFSKIESRKLELEAVPFSLSDVITGTLRPLSIQADQKQLELILDIAHDVPAGLIGDPVRLKQVLTNLVGNALKFTERGHIVIGVRMEAGNDRNVVLRFSVTDTGIGIPKDHHRSIFDAFRQADGSTTRRFGGTGLGLTIVSTLVELMGGYIQVESAPGQGSTFRFTAVFGRSATNAEPDRLPELEGVRVLIVDDNAVNRRVFVGQAASWGMLPHAVPDGRTALAALSDAAADGQPFSLVLLDANMPGLDGFEVAERIAESELAGAAVMLLTSSGQYGDHTRCRGLGIAAYLTKPVKHADLREAVSRALEGAQAVPTERRSNPPEAFVETRREAATPGGALKPVKVLLVEDNLVNQRVAVGILKKRGHQVTVAHHGQEALDLLAREPYELILMDLQMPVMGGFEATAAIRERERRGAPRVRIVAMTAHAMHGDRERCLTAGMDGYVTKPIDPRVLCAAVEEEGRAPSGAAVDRGAALQLMGGDEKLLMDVMRLFLADCPARLAAIKTAIDGRDAEQIRREAHGLKGASGNLAATALVEAATRLEKAAADSRLEGIDAAWTGLFNAAEAVLETLRTSTGPPKGGHYL